MTIRPRSRFAHITLLCVLLIIGPSAMKAEREKAIVKADSLAAFADMSAKSDVIATLSAGKSVWITFTASNAEGKWCAISDADSAEKLGFVQCSGLDRPNRPDVTEFNLGSAASGSVHSASASGVGIPSRTQQHWAMAAAAILATFNNEPLTTFPSSRVLGTKSLLRNSWEISSREDLLQTLEWIDKGGHRQLFSLLGARVANAPPDELSKLVSKLGPENGNSVMIAHQYYGKYAAQSITAWDYARYINVCRWGVAAGYLTEDEAWPLVMHAAQIIQQTFSSWSEFGENYLVGREFWSSHQTQIDGRDMRAIYRRLLNDPNSVWNQNPWNLPLQMSVSPIQNSSDSGDANKCQVLQHAAIVGDISTAESILQSRPDLINCRDSRYWTPLQTAAFNGQTAIIRTFIAHHATVEASDREGVTALHAAATSGHADSIEALLRAGAQVDTVDRFGNTALIKASEEANVGAVEILLSHGASIEMRNRDGNAPLQYAAMRGRVDVVNTLLDHGANLETQDKNGYTPLYSAVWYKQTEVISDLLSAHANVNTRSNGGVTPLNGAAENGCLACATILLEHGARVNTGDVHGFTPLHTAAANDHPEIASLLLEHGADIDERTNAGDTPLHWAAFKDKISTASLLLASGAHINLSDKDGNTPLHWAAAAGHVDMTEMLINHGADLRAKTRFGCTPLQGAFDAHQAATAQVLKRHGAIL